MKIIHEHIRLSEDDIEAGFFSPKDNGKSQIKVGARYFMTTP
jgi:hypothetical protein